jgi:hypothetical protein
MNKQRIPALAVARTVSGQRWMRTSSVFALALAGALLGGCANAPRIEFTAADQMAAVPVGGRNIRFWADSPETLLQDAAWRASVQKGEPFVYLALSGGGGGGAFGAGALNGWTESGTRPKFTVVSGVSVGAMIAPFAFLGPDYDATLREIYTNGTAEALVEETNPLRVLLGDGLIARGKLRELVGRYLTDDVLNAIAREDKKGRRLLVVTTNLDAQRAVIWDMGAIAAAGGPEAFKLFRDIIAASASVPVVFEPQLIDVAARGKQFQEMHVDGSVSAPVFILPDMLLLGGKTIAGRGGRQALYVIVNARLDAGFEVVKDASDAIATRAFGVMNRVETAAVLEQTYNASKRNGMGFHLGYIGKDVPDNGGTGFETDRMRALFENGHAKALGGELWRNKPPQVEKAVATAQPSAGAADKPPAP